MADGYIFGKEGQSKLHAMRVKLDGLHTGNRPQSPTTPPMSGATFRRFQLYDAIVPSTSAAYSSAAGRFCVWTSSSTAWTVSSSTVDNFTAYDELNSIRASSGAYGLVRRMAGSGRWEIVECQRLARRCSALLKGALASTAAGTVDGVTIADDGISPVASSTATITTVNPRKLAGPDNAVCGIIAKRSAWEIEYVVPSTQSIITSIQISTSGRKFQKKTRIALTNWKSTAESTWTTFHTGSTCGST